MHEKNQVSVFPFCLEADGLPIATRRLPIVQNLDFCLIFRKTKDPSGPCTDCQATYLTSGAIRKVLSPSSLHDRNHKMIEPFY